MSEPQRSLNLVSTKLQERHEKLLSKVQEKVMDGRVIELIEKFLKQEVMEGSRTWTPEEGSPQGAVLSPLLSNIYLDFVRRSERSLSLSLW